MAQQDMVEHAYNDWRNHHAKCEKCSVQRDWFDPGFPAIVDTPEEADKTVKLPDGRAVHLAHRADPESVLCVEGTRLFKTWVRAAAARPHIDPR